MLIFSGQTFTIEVYVVMIVCKVIIIVIVLTLFHFLYSSFLRIHLQNERTDLLIVSFISQNCSLKMSEMLEIWKRMSNCLKVIVLLDKFCE